jgi:uncharacterized protein YndB with AHSA1/START domain
MPIRKKAVFDVPAARIWRALTTPAEFSRWFGVVMQGSFKPGERIRMTSTHRGHEGVSFDVWIEDVEPPRLLTWRWHPGSAVPAPGETSAPKTLVLFKIRDIPQGSELTISETGFDTVPEEIRAAIVEDHSKAWEFHLKSLAQHVIA